MMSGDPTATGRDGWPITKHLWRVSSVPAWNELSVFGLIQHHQNP